MKVAHTGIVRKVYKDTVDMWCMEVERTETKTRGKTIYIGMKAKPKGKIGQKVRAGEDV